MSITLLYGPRYFAPIRYLVLFFRTLVILFQKQPDVVYAQNPPVFCPLTCLLYCRFTGARLIIDHHSIWKVKTLGKGALSKAVGAMEGIVSRAADGNTAPHRFWAQQLSSMGARNVLVVHDFVEPNPYPRDEALRRQFASEPLIAISSHGGHPLERMEAEAAGVGMVGSVALLITGPRAKLEGRLASSALPRNVRYLGFLERETYERLKASADFAINVTDEPYTLSHVLLEFAASSIPIISSRQAVLADFFGDSLLYTDSSAPAEIAAKVRSFQDASVRLDYRSRVERRYSELRSVREEELTRLRSLVGQVPGSARP